MQERFYQQDTIVKKAVEMLLVFPDDMQSVIAQGISHVTDQEFMTSRLNKHVQSLGAEKVMALFKSKQKKRDYDNNPQVHQMMNDLMILSPENRRFACEKMIELIGFITEYLQLCQAQPAAPKMETVENITETYVKMDKRACQEFMLALKKEFMNKLDNRSSSLSASKELMDTFRKEAVKDEGEGMKILGDSV